MEQQGPAAAARDSDAQMGFTPRKPAARDHMADLELVHFDVRDQRDQRDQEDTCSLLIYEPCGVGGGGGGGGEASAPWTETPRVAAETLEEETETSFIHQSHNEAEEDEDEEDDVGLIGTRTCGLTHGSSGELEEQEEEEESIPELYLLSGSDGSSGSGDQSVDYGFILAVSCLLTGISLVVVSYSVPRELRDPGGSVSARQMEQLQRDRARVWAHLDRCVMAGLSLLTLGGVLLVSLLLGSMWTAERMRRRAFALSKHAAGRYGSTSLTAAE